MFYYISGVVEHIEPQLVVVDCGGAGYALRTSNNTISGLKKGEKAKLYTHLYVREDIFELYGFLTHGELNCFRLLISISGVGPTAALSILSVSTPEMLAASIITGDEKTLTAAQGIGKKLAQRIILEMKGKLEKEYGVDAGMLSQIREQGIQKPVNRAEEAAAALSVLGYSSTEISSALKDIDVANLTLEQIIRSALKNMLRT